MIFSLWSFHNYLIIILVMTISIVIAFSAVMYLTIM